jgi:flagellar basal-body rod protein FlgB
MSVNAPSEDIKKIKPEEVQPNGNGVSLEQQMVDMTNSQLDYNTLLDLYRADVGMINTVLDKGH